MTTGRERTPAPAVLPKTSTAASQCRPPALLTAGLASVALAPLPCSQSAWPRAGVRNAGRTAGRLSLHLRSARRQAARDRAERAGTPGDYGRCRLAVYAGHER